jgi:hypothetical protein
MNHVTTRDRRHVDHLWIQLGGKITPFRRTGESCYRHPLFERPLRLSTHRKDAPAILISRLNQVLRRVVA